MKLVLVNENIIGKVLATPIYSQNGSIFMSKGMVFSQRAVQSIRNLGISTTYVEDDNDNVTVQGVIDVSLKLKVIKLLKEVFQNVKSKGKIDDKVIIDIVQEIINNINLSENAFLFNDIGKNDKDIDLYIHSLNVCILSILVGVSRKYDEKKLLNLGVAALLHDIGKLFFDDNRHAIEGYNFIKSTNRFPTTVYVAIYQHHENEDGSGYPQKLKGDRIYEFSRIIHICNHYENLLDSKDMSFLNETMEKIMAQSVSKFGEDVYKDFIKSIYCYPNGLSIRLNNGLNGTVVMQNKNFPLRPIVGVFVNDRPRLINLLDNLTLFIDKVII